jgi:hypothetical protein
MNPRKIISKQSIILILFVSLILSRFSLQAASNSDSVKININQNKLPDSQTIELSLPESPQFKNSIPNPMVEEDLAEGEFEITFSSINLTPNKKQQISGSNQQTPLSILLFFQDNRKLKLTVKTRPLKDLNSYYSIEQNKFYFDLTYSKSKNIARSFTSRNKETNISNSEKAAEKLIASNHESTPNQQEPENYTTANTIDKKSGIESKVGSILFRAVKSAIMVALIIIFLVAATILVINTYSGQNLLKPYLRELKNSLTKRKAKQAKKKSKTAKKIQQKAKPAQEAEYRKKEKEYDKKISQKITDVDDRVLEIRKIMDKQGLTYDEAELYYNMNRSNFSA